TIVRNFNRYQFFIAISGGKLDQTSGVSYRVASVQNQIRENLLQLDRVAINLWEFVRVFANDLDLTPAQLWFEQLQSVIQHAMNIHGGELGCAARARKIQKIVYDVGCAICLPSYFFQQSMFWIILGQHVEEHLRV